MLTRLKNPLADLDRQQKIVLGVSVAALLGAATLGAMAWAASADPGPIKKALEVGEACATFSIRSQHQLDDELRARLRNAAREGPIDPLRVTSRYLRAVAPKCATYPSNVQNPGQVKLFATIYNRLLEVMQQENFLASGDVPTWYNMMKTWAEGQGVPSEDL